MKECNKGLKDVTFTDLKRNWVLFSLLLAACVIYLVMLFLRKDIAEDDRWISYALYVYIVTLSTPLMYYIRYSDKNQKIIRTVINTKISKMSLYHWSFIASIIFISTIVFWFLDEVSQRKTPHTGLAVYLRISVVFVFVISNVLCYLLFKVIDRYYISLLVYLIIIFLLLSTNNVFWGLLCPLSFQIYGKEYLFGKLVECGILGSFIVIFNICKKR